MKTLEKAGRYYRTNYGKKQKKNISDFKDIDEETLRNKLAFLKDNGFPIISDSYDRDLRNSIAHMSFIVDEDGSLGYESKVKRKVNILTKEEVEDKMARLFIINQSINESIKQSKIYLT